MVSRTLVVTVALVAGMIGAGIGAGGATLLVDQGPQGPPGATGATGLRGAIGPRGASGESFGLQGA